jgi:pSer/pThr/pTyr-binding forkhead associated (FHA) protein
VVTVGRDEEADIRVDEPLVSRHHARIERRDGRYFVLDLGSTNRTRVNGAPVSERELKDGDEVRFARARCRFVLSGDLRGPDAAPEVS